MASGGGKGSKKVGRNKRRAARAGSPISLFVRNKITAGQYWNLAGIRNSQNVE